MQTETRILITSIVYVSLNDLLFMTRKELVSKEQLQK